MDAAGKQTDEMESMRLRSGEATAKGGEAYAPPADPGRDAQLRPDPAHREVHRVDVQRRRVAFDLFALRALDIEISDDMLLCIDALRWGRADLYSLVPDGDKRVKAVIERWGLKWPESL